MNVSDPARVSDGGGMEELHRAYLTGNLVVFVGAGVSAGAGLPSWRGLVETLVERARARGAPPEHLSEVQGLLGRGQLIDALSAVKDLLGGAEYGAVVERELDDRGRPVPEVAQAIAELAPGLRALLTTNLDHLLERALGGEWPALARATSDIAQRRRFILKLHGTLLDRATWVFTREDYDRAMYADPRLKTAFTALFHACPLLFVGYGLADDDFDVVLGQVRAFAEDTPPRHFALVPKESITPNRRKRLEAAGVRLLPYDNPDGRHTQLPRLLQRLRGPAPDAVAPQAPPAPSPTPDVPAPLPGQSPFPGLEAYDEPRAAWYFGRDAEVVELCQRLGDTPSRHRRWLQLEGPSGSGKSSLARAGLVPKVRKGWVEGAPSRWEVAVLRPGAEPLLALGQALHAALRAHLPAELTLDRLTRALEESETALAALLRERVPHGQGVLVVVDQLEEVFTLAGAEKAHRFDALLAAALRDKAGPLYLVTTLRSDFLGRFRDLPELELLLNAEASRYYVKPMSTPGLRFSPGLPERILEDASASDGALPLVAHALRALWTKRKGEVLTAEDYEALGGVSGALAQSADALLSELGDDGRERARRLLLRLVSLGRSGRQSTRRSISRAEALEAAGGGAAAEAVLARLSGGRNPDRPGDAEPPARLVVVTRSGAEDRVDLVHDALLRRWTTLRRWIDESRKALERRDDLEAAAKLWRAAGSPEDGLPAGAQLTYLRSAEGGSDEARAFLAAAEAREGRLLAQARARADAQLLEARRRVVRLRIELGVALLLLLAAGAAALLARREGRIAREASQAAQQALLAEQDARRTALSRELVAHALEHLDQDPPLSLRLILEALQQKDTEQAQEALRRWWKARLRTVLRPEARPLVTAFSRDGAHVLTAGEGGSAQLWNGRTGEPGPRLGGHTTPVRAAAFSPDGTRVLTGGDEGQAWLWDTASGTKVARLEGHTRAVSAVAFSPDGKRAATAGNDGSARLWDAATGASLGPPLKHAGLVSALAFSPDGQRLLTASADRSARVWSASGVPEPVTQRGHPGPVRTASFSPDGDRVVSAGDDGVALVWETASGKVLARLQGHSARVWSAVFSPDGKRLLTASSDGTARLWDAATGEETLELSGHAGKVWTAVFGPDGRHLVTAGEDGTARLWDAATGQELERLRGHQRSVQQATFSPDGQRVLTLSEDGAARLWDATELPEEGLLERAKAHARKLTCFEQHRYLHQPCTGAPK